MNLQGDDDTRGFKQEKRSHSKSRRKLEYRSENSLCEGTARMYVFRSSGKWTETHIGGNCTLEKEHTAMYMRVYNHASAILEFEQELTDQTSYATLTENFHTCSVIVGGPAVGILFNNAEEAYRFSETMVQFIRQNIETTNLQDRKHTGCSDAASTHSATTTATTTTSSSDPNSDTELSEAQPHKSHWNHIQTARKIRSRSSSSLDGSGRRIVKSGIKKSHLMESIRKGMNFVEKRRNRSRSKSPHIISPFSRVKGSRTPAGPPDIHGTVPTKPVFSCDISSSLAEHSFPGGVIRTGWLDKRSLRKASKSLKPFKKRFFVLEREQLRYYGSVPFQDAGAAQHGGIYFSTVTEVLPHQKRGGRYTITLVTDEESLTLGMKDYQTQMQWFYDLTMLHKQNTNNLKTRNKKTERRPEDRVSMDMGAFKMSRSNEKTRSPTLRPKTLSKLQGDQIFKFRKQFSDSKLLDRTNSPPPPRGGSPPITRRKIPDRPVLTNSNSESRLLLGAELSSPLRKVRPRSTPSSPTKANIHNNRKPFRSNPKSTGMSSKTVATRVLKGSPMEHQRKYHRPRPPPPRKTHNRTQSVPAIPSTLSYELQSAFASKKRRPAPARIETLTEGNRVSSPDDDPSYLNYPSPPSVPPPPPLGT